MSELDEFDEPRPSTLPVSTAKPHMLKPRMEEAAAAERGFVACADADSGHADATMGMQVTGNWVGTGRIKRLTCALQLLAKSW